MKEYIATGNYLNKFARQINSELVSVKKELSEIKKTMTEDNTPQSVFLNINFPSAYVIDGIVTAYAPSAGGINCSGDCNTTARVFKISALMGHEKVTYCAVDPRVIPFYSILIIQGYDKPCIAVDTGSMIKGNHIDLLIDDHKEAVKWGKRRVKVIVIPPDYMKKLQETVPEAYRIFTSP
jgi:3D (Asp-Asp-Asp) domain-containing protein